MNRIFSALTAEEYQKLKAAIPEITVLIAGADGNIDSKETSWAKKITKVRTYATSEEFHEYYEEIGTDFNDKLNNLIGELPGDVEARNAELSSRISELNAILAKLDPRVAANLYDDFRSFATHVARSSGGFLKFFAMSASEAKWAKLPMLHPVEIPDEEEEE